MRTSTLSPGITFTSVPRHATSMPARRIRPPLRRTRYMALGRASSTTPVSLGSAVVRPSSRDVSRNRLFGDARQLGDRTANPRRHRARATDAVDVTQKVLTFVVRDERGSHCIVGI